MNIHCLKEFDLGTELGQVRSVPVALGNGEEAMLFVYSQNGGIDPGEEYFSYPTDTLKLALYTMEGKQLWVRDLGEDVVPGIWFVPVLSFDLDSDGVDEIWFINNLNKKHPFSMEFRRLERIDPRTGETTGQWLWPRHTEKEPLSHCYRFYLAAGYAHGEPVLITSQGTYGDMFLQAYSKGMEKRWEIAILESDPGPRASHVTPVMDFNQDGVDEIFWGERLLSVDDGHEVLCCNKDDFREHSDVVIPYTDINTGKKYIFTCREDHEVSGVPRVLVYDENGDIAWSAVEKGHMHYAWVANLGENYRKVAMAMKVDWKPSGNQYVHEYDGEYYFDAITGEPVQLPFPYRGSDFLPIDMDGDGYHELYCRQGEMKGWLIDRFGNKLTYIEGEMVHNGKILREPGEHMMMYRKEGKVCIWGDKDAVESEVFKARHSSGYHAFGQHLMAAGYNMNSSNLTCGI